VSLHDLIWSDPLNNEIKLPYSGRYILNEELKGFWGNNDRSETMEARGETCHHKGDKREWKGYRNMPEIFCRPWNVLQMEGIL